MVQVIENRADLIGRLVAIREDPTRPGYRLALVDVEAVSEVPSYANLLGQAGGARIELVIPDAHVGLMKPGDAITCRARRTGPSTVFADACTVNEPAPTAAR
jgi:hypothetical protein